MIALFAWATACANAQAAGQWPAMTGEVSRQECSGAFEIAKGMFRSSASLVYAPLLVPESAHSRLVLGASARDISGGDALTSDLEAFEKTPKGEGPYNPRSVYWGKESGSGGRIVVVENSHGWRGDTYELYVPKPEVEKSDFIRSILEQGSPTPYMPLMGGWRPPLVFSLNTGSLWFVDVNPTGDPLDAWHVYAAKGGRYERLCTISFRPSSQDVSTLLPERVQTLMQLLDLTIGPGNDEGTLHPTARLRDHVQHVLVNAVQRPWALIDSDTYNSREEVNAGLKAWVNGPRSRAIYQDILRAYPLAEHALSSYYETQYGLPSKQARDAATWVMDIVFRAHYAFSTGGDYFRYENVNTNPWNQER